MNMHRVGKCGECAAFSHLAALSYFLRRTLVQYTVGCKKRPMTFHLCLLTVLVVVGSACLMRQWNRTPSVPYPRQASDWKEIGRPSSFSLTSSFASTRTEAGTVPRCSPRREIL